MGFELFLERLNSEQKKIFEFLDNSFLSFPEVNMKIRYRIPFYDYYSWVCYVNPIKKSGLELCFIHGQLLSAHGSLLESRDRKQVSGIIIENLSEDLLSEMLDVFSEALILDESMSRNKTSP